MFRREWHRDIASSSSHGQRRQVRKKYALNARCTGKRNVINQPRSPLPKGRASTINTSKNVAIIRTLAQPSERLRIDQGINQIPSNKNTSNTPVITPALTVHLSGLKVIPEG